MMGTMEKRELDDDYSSSSSREFAELDSEIRRMSLHADSILQSIQEVSGDMDDPYHIMQMSPGNQLTISQKVHHTAATPSQKPQAYLSYEDDDMTEEEERLELISKSIRESLAESNMNLPKRPPVDYSMSTDYGANLVEKRDEVEQSSEILLLGCTIVCAMVMILFVHAQYFLLNAKGYVQFPFGL